MTSSTPAERSGWTAIGGWAWAVAAPVFLVAQLIAGSAWPRPYSWSRNNISDLGNVTCGAWGEDQRYVCSPLHGVMNVGFVLTGVLVVAGVLLGWRSPRSGSSIAKATILLAGTGYVAAGLGPADRHENIHVVLGALPILFAGYLGLLLMALRDRRPPWSRVAALLLGVVGTTATALFLSRHHLGLGLGGLERLAAWPLLVFLAITGVGRRTGQ